MTHPRYRRHTAIIGTRLACAVIALLLSAERAHAQQRIDFRGVLNANTTDADFSGATTFAGFFLIDPTATGVDHPDVTLTDQYLAITGWRFDFLQPDLQITGDRGVIAVGDAAETGIWFDRLTYTFDRGMSGYQFGSGRELNFLQFDFIDPSGAMVTGRGIPTDAPDLSGVAPRFRLSFRGAGEVRGTVTSMEVARVPEPAAVGLLLAAGGLLLIRGAAAGATRRA